MRYLAIYTPAKTRPQRPDDAAAMDRFVAESYASGELISTGALLPLSQGGMQVKNEGGELTFLDGPYAEAKEVIVGYAILELPTKEAARAALQRFLRVAGDGECELRQLMDQGAPPDAC
ncbi:MAG: YciI family protein [Polyangiales bacterium]